MGRFEVRVAERAMAEIRTISRWWRKNRRASPLLFDRELETILELLEFQPEIGKATRLRDLGEARFVVLRRSRHLVAYQILSEERQVWILRVRHGSRRPILRAR